MAIFSLHFLSFVACQCCKFSAASSYAEASKHNENYFWNINNLEKFIRDIFEGVYKIYLKCMSRENEKKNMCSTSLQLWDNIQNVQRTTRNFLQDIIIKQI